jgi:hypothetical protein
MYTISKVPPGRGQPRNIILTCSDCTHIESVNQFNPSLGSQRTQAARAMQMHSIDKHRGPLKLLQKNYDILALAAVNRRTWVFDR